MSWSSSRSRPNWRTTCRTTIRRRTHDLTRRTTMEMLLVFAAGYVMGARAGSESLDEVITAANAIRESDEFHDFVKAMRKHAAFSLRGLATVIERGRQPA